MSTTRSCRPDLRRALALPALLVATSAVGGCTPDRAGGPELVVPQEVPDDVSAELATVWSSFRDVFPGRLACIPDVTLFLVAEVEGGDARYVPGAARIEIAIPTTPARFRESVAHELAHHVEHTCDEFGALRGELAPLLGGPDAGWSSDGAWADRPAERWAEHVVVLVNGERVRFEDEIEISDVALAAIARWGAAD